MRAMFSLMQLTADAHGLVIAYHPAVGATLVATAVALATFVAVRGNRIKRRWPLLAAIAIAGWSGVHFATFTMRLTPESAAIHSLLQKERVSWQDAAAVYLEKPRTGDPYIVVVDRARRAFEVYVADLSAPDRERAMAYMLARINVNEPRRAPAVERRPKTLDALSDQQI